MKKKINNNTLAPNSMILSKKIGYIEAHVLQVSSRLVPKSKELQTQLILRS